MRPEKEEQQTITNSMFKTSVVGGRFKYGELYLKKTCSVARKPARAQKNETNEQGETRLCI